MDEAKYYELELLIKLIEEKIEANKLKINMKLSDELFSSSSHCEMNRFSKQSSRYHPYDSSYEKLLDEAGTSQISKAKQTALILKSAFKTTCRDRKSVV